MPCTQPLSAQPRCPEPKVPPGLVRTRGRPWTVALCCLWILPRLWHTPLGAAEPPPPPTGWEALHRLDLLPAYRQSSRIGMASSYDRSGGNDDGFSGRHSVLRQEPAGLVIADLQGPGVVHRIWTPTPSDDPMDFYFDGEASPRFSVSFRELFLGNHPPFVKPLVGYGVGGFFSYVPIPFAKSCKIVIRGDRVQFHQINYSIYPPDTPIRSFQAELPSADRLHYERAIDLFSAAHRDPLYLAQAVAPQGAGLLTTRRTFRLAHGNPAHDAGGAVNPAVLYESSEPGRILGLRLSPATALIGKERSLVLRLTFDGDTPTVLCPAGDFFGYAWGEPAMRSLLIGADAQSAYCYFPMPFDRSARLELLSEATAGPPVELTAEVIHAPIGRQSHEGRFHAVWRRENPTTIGQPFTFLDTQGRGHVVGVVLQSQGLESGKTLFFEGDDQTPIDGDTRHSRHRLGGLLQRRLVRRPGSLGKTPLVPLERLPRLPKTPRPHRRLPTPPRRRLPLPASQLRPNHRAFGTDNNIPTDYCAVTYLYAERLPAGTVTLPPLAARAVVDPTEVIFPAWWQIPIRAWTFQNASLSRGRIKVGDEEIRFLSTRADGQDWFGPPFLYLTLDLPTDGQYQVQIVAVKGPAQGKIQLFADEIPVGDPVDLYSAQLEKSGRLPLGSLPFRQGQNELMLKIIGKNEAATALGLDLVEIVCLRQTSP